MNAGGLEFYARCEALTRIGTRCTFTARTRHYLEGNAGESMLLCRRHDRMLDTRARHEHGPSEAELLAEWRAPRNDAANVGSSSVTAPDSRL